MNIWLILLIVLLLCGTGGGFYTGWGATPIYAGGNHIGIIGLVLLVIVVVYALRGGI